MKKIAILIILVVWNKGVCQTFEMVKNINNTPEIRNSSFTPKIVELGGFSYYIPFDKNNEIWKTDGTPSGTILFKSFDTPGIINLIASNNNKFYFNNYGLWVSDGTIEGTIQISSNIVYSGSFLNNGRFIYQEGNNMKSTDGTVNGTNTILNNQTTFNFTVINNFVFYTKNLPNYLVEIWKSDGITSTLVVNSGDLRIFGTWNNNLLFAKRATPSIFDLYKTDGTLETLVLNNFNIQNSLIETSNPNLLYFFENGQPGKLWRCDGTVAGTYSLVTENYISITQGVNINGLLYFAKSVQSGLNFDFQLYKTDGTVANTSKISNFPILINCKDNLTNTGEIKNLFNVNNQLIFTKQKTFYGNKSIYKWNIATNQAELLKEAIDNITVPNSVFGTLSSNLLFTFHDTALGESLWKTDGTSAGTILLKDQNGNTNGSSVTLPLKVGNLLYFSGNDGLSGQNLWKTDGTTSGTVLVKDIRTDCLEHYPGTTNSIQNLTEINNKVVFTAYHTSCIDCYPNNGQLQKLFTSDGTSAGTSIINEYPKGAFFKFKNYLYFASTNNQNIQRTNGIISESWPTIKISPFSNFYTNYIQFINDKMYFNGYLNNVGGVIRTDGTEAGSILMPTGFSMPLFNTNNKFIFINPLNIYETKSSDLDGNNQEIFDIFNPNNYNLHFDITQTYPAQLSNYRIGNNVIYWGKTTTPTQKAGLFVTDGTIIGTIFLTGTVNPSEYVYITSSQLINNILYFTKKVDIYNGYTLVSSNFSLWKSDGTSSGTQKIYDSESNSIEIKYGNNSYLFLKEPNLLSSYNLTTNAKTDLGNYQFGFNYELNGRLFFSSASPDNLTGHLYSTDGISIKLEKEKFQMVSAFQLSSSTILFANDYENGIEPWKMTFTPCTTMYTTKSGDINDPTVWSCNRIPAATDIITIETGHIINIPSGNFSIKNIVLKGDINFATNGILNLSE